MRQHFTKCKVRQRRCTGVFLGMQKMFPQILILFYSQTTYKQQILM